MGERVTGDKPTISECYAPLQMEKKTERNNMDDGISFLNTWSCRMRRSKCVSDSNALARALHTSVAFPN
jgi:hypothetical protein